MSLLLILFLLIPAISNAQTFQNVDNALQETKEITVIYTIEEIDEQIKRCENAIASYTEQLKIYQALKDKQTELGVRAKEEPVAITPVEAVVNP